MEWKSNSDGILKGILDILKNKETYKTTKSSKEKKMSLKKSRKAIVDNSSQDNSSKNLELKMKHELTD